MQRGGQVWVILVSSVLLTALLQGCPGGGDDDESRFAGTWQGTTSQGKNVSFVVTNDHTITTVTAEAHVTGNGCTATDLALSNRVATSEPMAGNRFAVVVVPSRTLLPNLSASRGY